MDTMTALVMMYTDEGCLEQRVSIKGPCVAAEQLCAAVHSRSIATHRPLIIRKETRALLRIIPPPVIELRRDDVGAGVALLKDELAKIAVGSDFRGD